MSIINHVTQPTHFTSHSATLIDLISTIIDAPLLRVTVDHIPELGGHSVVCADFKIKKVKSAPKRLTFRPIKNISLERFNEDLYSIDLSDIMVLDCVNEMTERLNKLMIELFDSHAPIRSVILHTKQIPWLTSNVKLMIELRNQAHIKFKITKSDMALDQYKSLKRMVNVALYFEKKAFFEQNINCNIGDCNIMEKIKTICTS